MILKQHEGGRGSPPERTTNSRTAIVCLILWLFAPSVLLPVADPWESPTLYTAWLLLVVPPFLITAMLLRNNVTSWGLWLLLVIYGVQTCGIIGGLVLNL